MQYSRLVEIYEKLDSTSKRLEQTDIISGFLKEIDADGLGTIILDEKELEQRLNQTNRVHGIYVLEGDTSFVPYVSFERGVQEHEKFLEGGLARGLVHTADKKATTLSSIANKEEYPQGVNVWGFDSVKSPVLRVVRLLSVKYLDGGSLDVGGDSWDEDDYGYAFGGLVSGEASAPKNLGD